MQVTDPSMQVTDPWCKLLIHDASYWSMIWTDASYWSMMQVTDPWYELMQVTDPWYELMQVTDPWYEQITSVAKLKPIWAYGIIHILQLETPMGKL